MEIIIPIIAAIVGIAGGAGAVFVYDKKNENGGKNKADDLVRKAKNEASDIVSKARKEAADVAEKSKNEEDERRKEWKKTENRLSERESLLDGKLDQLEKKSEDLLMNQLTIILILKLRFVISAQSNKRSSRKLLVFQKLKQKTNLWL